MKKQIKFKTFLLSNILFLNLICIGQINKNYILTYIEQDTVKLYTQQVQKLNQINSTVDSVKLKWDAIEKALKEKQSQPK